MPTEDPPDLAVDHVETWATVDGYLGVIDEVCFSGDPFSKIVQETQGNDVMVLNREDAGTTPYSARRREN